jgi:hypothetical protein
VTKRTTTTKAVTNLGENAIRPILLRVVKLKANTILQGTGGPSPSPIRRGKLAGAGREGGREEVEEGELSEPSRRSSFLGKFGTSTFRENI